MPAVAFDIWDQAQLDRVVKNALTTGRENLPSLGDQLAPMHDVKSRKVKWRVSEVDAFGVGQLRAPDGNPQLYRSSMSYRDEMVELALPDEMERISEDIMLRLQSSDPAIQATAGVSLADRGVILALRNKRAIERMRWECFLTGKVTLTYLDSDFQVDFGIPATHFITAGTLWSDTVNADIVAQVRAWQKIVADDIGEYALDMYMNSDTYEYVYNNAKIRALLSSYGRSLMVSTGPQEVASLFREGTTIYTYDGGIRNVGVSLNQNYNELNNGTSKPNSSRGNSSLTKYLPDGKVLFTTKGAKVDGQQIADTPNGQVMIGTGYNNAVALQGPQSETILDHFSKNTYLRYASAAIPRLLLPEAFLVATVL